jgi:Tol biopolymer transport system component
MRSLLSALTLLAALAALAGCGGGGKGSDIAFVSTRDGDYAIFAMGADGGGQHRLTSRDSVDVSTPQRLFFQVEPAWSPDGSKIAFASRRAGTFDIYVMNADGTQTERLTSGKSIDNHPSYSPGGDLIAFVRDSDIYVMNADGTGQRAVTGIDAEDFYPAWSPDGQWIAFVRRAAGVPSKEVWVTHPDGTDRHALTSLGGDALQPAWSPDSKQIVFSSKPPDGARYELRTVGVDGKGLRGVVPTVSDNFAPSWSPDGERIAYVEDGAVFTVELGGGDEVEKLTSQDSNDSSPVWNPQRPAADE